MSPCEVPPPRSILPGPSSLQQLLKRFSITQNGFLPEEVPLAWLPDPYYAPWEALIPDLPTLIENRTLRHHVDQLPVLSANNLTSEPEQRRAYVVLCFLAQGYIWGGNTASEVLPPQLTVPLLSVSSTLGLPPIATYAAFNLWNFHTTTTPTTPTTPTSTASFRDLDTIHSQHTFTGTPSESWFYSVSIAIEASGASIIPTMLSGLSAAHNTDFPTATAALHSLTACIAHLGTLLDRMDENCDPEVFYHKIRPFLAGSKNMEAAGLPNGVFYDEGEGRGRWRELRGGSNGQSSLIQFFDVVLGVVHAAGGDTSAGDGKGKGVSFHEEVREYMPGPHREFLEYVGGLHPGGMRGVLEKGKGEGRTKEEGECRVAFTAATEALAAFRGKHLQMVTRYIIIPSRQAANDLKRRKGDLDMPVNLATASSVKMEGVERGAKAELTGTGGTALLPFLKKSRDETVRAGEIAR